MGRQYTFRDLIDVTRTVVREFDAVERRPWTVETVMIELMKQVGDLSRRVLTMEQYYLADRDRRPEYETSASEIGDELADILYCVIRIAARYDVDLEHAFLEARRGELAYLGKDTPI